MAVGFRLSCTKYSYPLVAAMEIGEAVERVDGADVQ